MKVPRAHERKDWLTGRPKFKDEARSAREQFNPRFLTRITPVQIAPLRRSGVDGVSLTCKNSELPGKTAPRETVLIVDDEPAIRAAVRHILEKQNFHVLEARNAERAVNVARSHNDRIDVLVADVILPGMNGLQMAGEIRQLHPETQIIFVSAHCYDPAVRRTVAEYPHFLPKPFAGRDLLDRIRRLLGAGGSGLELEAA